MKKNLFFFALLLAVFTSCKKDSTHTVEYTIQGTSKSTITYTDANGNLQTVNNAASSWTTQFTSNDSGLALKLTVVSSDGSSVGGKIYIDSKQTAQNNGATGSVTVSATLP